MFLDENRKPLIHGIHGRALGNRPALENSAHFEPQIVVQSRSGMHLHYESQRSRCSLNFSGWLSRLVKVAFSIIFL